MAFLKNIIIITLLSQVGFFIYAQEPETDIPRKQEKLEPVYDSVANRVLLRQEYSGGIVLHSRGWGLHFRKGRNINYFRSLLWEADVVSLKSPRQIKTINPYVNNAKSYVYGKLNHIYIVRAGLGFKKLLNRKPYWGGIELRLVYFGGFSLAFSKPVYLYILNYSVATEDYTIDIEKYDPAKHGLDNIYGRAPFMHGIENSTLHPGIYGKLGLNFEFGEYNSSIKAVEIGIILDYYPLPIQVMAENPRQSLVLTFLLGFSFGKRYN